MDVYFYFLFPGVVMCDQTQQGKVSTSWQFKKISCSIRAGAAPWVETHHVFGSLSENPGPSLSLSLSRYLSFLPAHIHPHTHTETHLLLRELFRHVLHWASSFPNMAGKDFRFSLPWISVLIRLFVTAASQHPSISESVPLRQPVYLFTLSRSQMPDSFQSII